jgi:protein-S-isoprenylcysteine O-methyltransferase Ste14
MSPTYARVIVFVATLVFWILRGVIKLRAAGVPVAKRRVGALEVVVIVIASAGMLLPWLWLATPALAFADYSTHPLALIVGTVLLGWGLWLLHRTNGDLGSNWSASLELKEDHRLVTEGVYRRIRHPMYLSLLLFAAGQTLALPNYVAGPTSLVAMIILVVFRLPAEERLMLEAFGEDYEAYQQRSSRLVPGLW